MHHLSSEMQGCINASTNCHQVCLSTAMGHCLEVGGEHVEQAHFSLMMACAEICRTTATLMLIGSPRHKQMCRQCAEICEECAADCERLQGMEECVSACRSCAESCRQMAA